MFRTTIQLSEKTDLELAIDDLRARAGASGLGSPSVHLMEQEVRALLQALLPRGRQLAAAGSTMHVAQEIVGAGYAVTIVCRVGERRSLLQRLLRVARRS